MTETEITEDDLQTLERVLAACADLPWTFAGEIQRPREKYLSWLHEDAQGNVGEVFYVAAPLPGAGPLKDGDECAVIATTGNGPRSSAHAIFFTMAGPAVRALIAEVRRQRAELEEQRAVAEQRREDHGRACETIAQMHAAALGEVTGPVRGVVEDVADLREERDRLRAELDRARKELIDARRGMTW